jgi:hypothetical protein
MTAKLLSVDRVFRDAWRQSAPAFVPGCSASAISPVRQYGCAHRNKLDVDGVRDGYVGFSTGTSVVLIGMTGQVR